MASIGSGGFITSGGSTVPVLSALVTGANPSTLTYQWTTTVGSTVTIVSSSSTYQPPIPAPGLDSMVVVGLKVTDSYGVSSSYSAQVDLLNDTNPVFDVTAPTTPVSSIFVSDLVGGKTIVGGTAILNVNNTPILTDGLPTLTGTILTTPITFDGTGAETFIGDNASDKFYLHANGATAYGEGAGNTFVLIPNCTLTAVARSDNNTLDFSSSTLTSGITFNLNVANGTPQNVDAADPAAEHEVAINDLGNANAFSTLVGSNMADNLTAATGSTIIGGGGMDTVNLPSVSKVNIQGSTGGNAILSSGSGRGEHHLHRRRQRLLADARQFHEHRLGHWTRQLLRRPGLDHIRQRAGNHPTGNISFSGDQGSTTFNNGPARLRWARSASAGDQGSATFNNGAGTTLGGSISFSGDQGSATFNNGPIAIAISYSGDQGSATFGNGPTTSAAMISFSGDQGLDHLQQRPGRDRRPARSVSVATRAPPPSTTGSPPRRPRSASRATRAPPRFNNGSVTTGGMISFTGDQGSNTFNNGTRGHPRRHDQLQWRPGLGHFQQRHGHGRGHDQLHGRPGLRDVQQLRHHQHRHDQLLRRRRQRHLQQRARRHPGRDDQLHRRPGLRHLQ